MRDAVRGLIELGSMPASDCTDSALVDTYASLITSLTPPLAPDEARELVKIFAGRLIWGVMDFVAHDRDYSWMAAAGLPPGLAKRVGAIFV